MSRIKMLIKSSGRQQSHSLGKKVLNTNKLMLIEKNNLISKESVLVNTMNQYFTSITKRLNLRKSPQLKKVEDMINYYQDHIITEKINSSNNVQSESSLLVI